MLENSLFESQGRRKTRKPTTVVVSAIVHIVTVAVLVLIPLMQTQAIVIPPVDMALLIPRTEIPESIQVFSQPSPGRRQPIGGASVFTPPTAIPEQIPRIFDPPLVTDVPFTTSSRGTGLLHWLGPGGSGPEGIAEPRPPAPQPLPVPPPPPIVDSRPIRQGGIVQEANLIYQVKPVYPAIARTARVQGIVVLEALIAKDGSINSLRVISGNPLLTPAALDAVKQWRYRPTMLNREPVEVITTITVTFTLQ